MPKDVVTTVPNARGERRKTILLVGFTQNGKSSFVKQILSYSHYDTSSVKVGNGCVSETQACSAYRVTVPIREHRLISKATKKSVEPTPDTNRDHVKVEDGDVEELLEIAIVDTPGLSDSNNSTETSDHQIPRSRVDGRHMLSIFRAIVNLGRVDAICFVSKENYGAEYRKFVSLLVETFSRSLSNTNAHVSYYVVHTNTGKRERFQSDKLRARQADFDRIAGIRPRHHFVDNKPGHRDPVSQFLAKRSLAAFFRDISRESGTDLSTIHYTRDFECAKVDEDLWQALRDVEIYHEKSASDLEPVIAELREITKILHASIAKLEKRVSDLDSQIQKLDTDEDVEIRREERTTGSVGVGWQEEGKVFTCPLPISKVEELDSNGYATWKGTLKVCPTNNKKAIGTLSCTHWWNEAKSTVAVYSKKRDKEAQEISALQQTRDTVKAKILGFRAGLVDPERELAALEKGHKRHKDIIQQTEEDKEKFFQLNQTRGGRRGHYPLEADTSSFRAQALLTATNAYAAGAYYNMQAIISVERLPSVLVTEKSVEEFTFIDEKARYYRQIASSRRRLRELLYADMASKRRGLGQLDATIVSEAEGLAKRLQQELRKLKATKLSVPTAAAATEDETMKRIVGDATRQANGVGTCAVSALEDLAKHLEDWAAYLAGAREVFVQTLAEMAGEAARLDDEVEALEAGVEAAAEVTRLCTVDAAADEGEKEREFKLPVGAFASIWAAMLGGKESPFVELWRDVAEKIRVEKWAARSSMVVYDEAPNRSVHRYPTSTRFLQLRE